MSPSNPCLPPGCVLRQADPRDRLEVKKILFQALNWDKIIYISIGFCLFFAPVLTVVLAIQLLICILVGASILFISYKLNILKYWVIECNSYIVAFGALYCHETHSTISRLYVKKRWRRKGLGSTIINFFIQKGTKPIYLSSLPNRVSFYTRLGFIPISCEKITKTSRAFRKSALVLMKYQ
ncbi:MAG: hypothetical protein N4J56_004038 [Chroococcidiopsis sp. SAG 2025]|uniref:GNAT family N-acetyltransferase n=1 Tax=Chroococcidiopsis sp. SAG 2025 TaxID=171389 RepID=UPI0029389094|nr:hypothetical protein [Chroococcidiopsis sp. SAG 2025]